MNFSSIFSYYAWCLQNPTRLQCIFLDVNGPLLAGLPACWGAALLAPSASLQAAYNRSAFHTWAAASSIFWTALESNMTCLPLLSQSWYTIRRMSLKSNSEHDQLWIQKREKLDYLQGLVWPWANKYNFQPMCSEIGCANAHNSHANSGKAALIINHWREKHCLP